MLASAVAKMKSRLSCLSAMVTYQAHELPSVLASSVSCSGCRLHRTKLSPEFEMSDPSRQGHPWYLDLCHSTPSACEWRHFETSSSDAGRKAHM